MADQDMKIRELAGSAGCSLGVSFFIGFILVAITAGSIWPGIDQFAASGIICRYGTFQIHQDTYSYRPGQSDTMTTDTCTTHATGVKRDVSGLTTVVSGLVYSLTLWVIILAVTAINGLVGRLRVARAA